MKTFLMADKPFRVLLDLTELHIEYLKYVWISVSPQELKTIADFKASVIRKINLDNVIIKLFVRNGLLLDNETVLILREDDIVKVCYVDDQSGGSHNDCKGSIKLSRKRNHTEDFGDSSTNVKKYKSSKSLNQEKEAFQIDETCSKKKKKHKSLSLSLENVYNPSISNEVENYNVNLHNKNKESTSEKNKTVFNSLKESDLFISFDNQDSLSEKNSKKCKTNSEVNTDSFLNLNSANDSLSFNVNLEPGCKLKESFDINTETIKSSEGLNNNCPKKKRKRRKKRKQVSGPVEETIGSIEIKKEFNSFKNESENTIKNKHIIYPSSSSNQEDSKLDYDSKNEDVKDVITSTFILEESLSNKNIKPNNYPKISTPAQSDFCKNPKWCSSLMQHTDLNFNQDETSVFKEGKYENNFHKNYADKQSETFDKSENSKNSTELNFSNLPDLNFRPEIGTHIAYKILELDEHYSPVISDYREGIVKSINLGNEELEIELLKHEIRPGRTGKFENLKQDEVPVPEVKTCDIVRWSALVEPKIVC